MLLCDYIIDNGWAYTYAEVSRLCCAHAIKVNGEIEENIQRPVQYRDVVEVGLHRKGTVE